MTLFGTFLGFGFSAKDEKRYDEVRWRVVEFGKGNLGSGDCGMEEE